MGPVGVSSRHAWPWSITRRLHADLIRLAVRVRDTVALRFGVTLVPEPVFLGVAWPAWQQTG